MHRFMIMLMAGFVLFEFMPAARAAWTDPNAANIVANYTFDAGNANDYSSYSNHGTASSVVFTNGTADFGGGGSYVSVPDRDWLSFGNATTDSPFTVAFWIYRKTGVPATATIASKYFDYQGAGQTEWFINGAACPPTMTLCDMHIEGQDNSLFRASSVDLPGNAWSHVIFTYDGSATTNGFNVYINGVLRNGTATKGNYVAMHNTTAALEFARLCNYADIYYGITRLDQFKIYNKALSAVEVQVLYWNTAPNVGLSQWSCNNPAQWSNEVLELTMSGTAQDWSPKTNLCSVNSDVSFSNGVAWFNGNYYLSGGVLGCGDKDYFSLGNGYTNDAFTLSCWLNPRGDWAQQGHPISKFFNWSYEREWYIGFDASHCAFMTIEDLNGGDTPSATVRRLSRYATVPSQLGVWQHVVFSSDGSGGVAGFNVYVNGVLANGTAEKGADFVAPHNTAYPMELGRAEFGMPQVPGQNRFYYYNGGLDQVRLMKKTVSASDVAELYWSDWVQMGQLPYFRDHRSLWSNCVAAYTFDMADATDYSLKTNNGTSTAVSFTDGAATFNGLNSYVNCGDRDYFSFGNGTTDFPFSVSFWVRKPDGHAYTPRIAGKWDGSSSEWEWTINQQDGYNFTMALSDLQVEGQEERLVRSSSVNLVPNTWTYVVFTYDGSGTTNGFNVYVNGLLKNGDALKGSAYVATHNLSHPLFLGVVNGNSTYYANSSLDQFLIFNRALTASEIQDIYNSTRWGLSEPVSQIIETGSVFEF